MKLSELAKKEKILIAGFGIEGKATLKFLKHHFPKKKIDIVDKKDGPAYLARQNEYDLVIKSPGIPKGEITAPYTTATNIFFANTKGFIIGVTGSKGKSTTTSLIHHILSSAGLNTRLIGNIGNPMLAALQQEMSPSQPQKTNFPQKKESKTQKSSNHIYCCELSSYQLDDIHYSPDISLILNLFPEHMDYHGGVKKYFQAKKRIVAKATPEKFFIYNPDYPELKELAQKTKAKALPFIKKIPFSKKHISLLGKHNEANIRAALTVIQLLKIDPKIVVKAIKSFHPLPHRLQKVDTIQGVTFYDDAISTTPHSTIQAIEALSALKPIGTILLGGTDRGYHFEELAKIIKKHQIKNIVLFPESGEKILTALKNTYKHDPLPNILKTKSMKLAVDFAYKNTSRNSICLLSTASPSYSLWKNFEQKGDSFQKLINKKKREN